MFYHLAMAFIRVYTRIRFRVNIKGIENIPKDKGVIICSNHISNFDPIMICSNVPRVVHYFAKKELFDTPFKKYFMNKLQAFPVDRENTDIDALKKSISLLKEGKVLGIFAQGTRVKNGETPAETKSGVSLFALKSGVDVVPIGITANYKRGTDAILNIGKPISFEKYKGKKAKSEVLNEMTYIIMDNIQMLIEQNKNI